MFKVISSSSKKDHVRKSRGGVLVVYFRKQACCYYKLSFISTFLEKKLVKFVAKISMCFKLHALKQNRKNRFLEVCRV